MFLFLFLFLFLCTNNWWG